MLCTLNKFKILLFILVFSTSSTMFGQDPYLQKDKNSAEKQANELTRAYQAELGMTVEQAVLFQKKAEEFVLRRNEIISRDFTTKEKLGLLKRLSKQETAEMANILTLPQVRQYKKLKKDIQPIQVVVGEL